MSQAGRDIGREKETSDHLTAGPGLVATKSQAKGATGGFALGAIGGAVIGLIVGALIGGASIWIGPIVFAVGGAVAMAVFGGFARSQKTREQSRVDV